jgi:hypothetical protein
MNVLLTDIEVDQFNSLFEKGCELQKSPVILDKIEDLVPGRNVTISEQIKRNHE